VDDDGIGEGRRSTADRVAIPRALFMSPPLATVGLTDGLVNTVATQAAVAQDLQAPDHD
jgi:pyruvate/2-oxoglutarate dehydrogenase complex dihydrolipoamide dehydrogenase (E3) component